VAGKGVLQCFAFFDSDRGFARRVGDAAAIGVERHRSARTRHSG